MHYSLGESNQQAPSSETIGAAAYSELLGRGLLMHPNTNGECDSGGEKLVKMNVNENFGLNYCEASSYRNIWKNAGEKSKLNTVLI